MSLSSYLTKPLRWLRAGYPSGSPRHGHVPLIALMASPAARTGNPPHADERPVLLTPGIRQAAHDRRELTEARDRRPDQAVAARFRAADERAGAGRRFGPGAVIDPDVARAAGPVARLVQDLRVMTDNE